MLKKWIIEKDGLVFSAGLSSQVPPGAEQTITPFSVEHLARCMVVNGKIVERPSSPAIVGSGPFSIGPCPAGTRIDIVDLLGQDICLSHVISQDGTVEMIDLIDAGKYRIEVIAPAPALMSSREVTVS